MEHPSKGRTGNKTRSYFLYAIGEILLVVVGILIALQVNNWNQERIDQKTAAYYETRLLEDIYEEKAILEAVTQYQHTVRSYALKAMNVLESGEQPGQDSGSEFIINLYQASQLQNPTPAISTYQELISAGKIGMIRNDSLRTAVITFYNYDWANRNVISDETPYRQNIRNLIPNSIQSLIRVECGDHYSKIRNSLKAVLPEQCVLEFDPGLTQLTVREILADESIKKDLRFKIGTLDVRLVLLTNYIDEVDEIIRQFKKNT